MIISLTGKPCSGKGEVSKLFCSTYGFEYLSTGQLFREAAIKLNVPISNFNNDERIRRLDKKIDSDTIKIGKKRIHDNIIFDSRLAWHFIPKSFKVFLDVSWKEAGNRLVHANRSDEQQTDEKKATKELKARWEAENKRYMELYGVNNLEKSNYNLVIKTDNKSVEEIVELIYKEYEKFVRKA